MKSISITDVCEFQGGTQPPKSEWSKESTSDRIRMLQIRDFTQSEKDNIEYVRKSEKLKTCGADDILIGRYGASIGKILTGLSGAYNVAIVKSIPDPEHLTKQYLYHLLRSPIFQNFIQNVSARAAQAGFNKSDLEKFKIPDLSLDDQIKIATLLSRVEALITTRKENLRLLDEFLKSTFLEVFGDPVRNEKGWERKPLEKLGSINRGVSRHRPRNAPELLGGDYPLIQTGDVANSSTYVFNYTQTYSEVGLKQSKIWAEGTLCITIAANIAKTSILTFSACFPDSVVGFLPYENVSNALYVHFLFSFFQRILETSAPHAAQKNINLAILRNLYVPCPPLDIQILFSQVVDKVEGLKKLYQQNLAELENLYGSLSQKAFKGELEFSDIPTEKKDPDKNTGGEGASVCIPVEITDVKFPEINAIQTIDSDYGRLHQEYGLSPIDSMGGKAEEKNIDLTDSSIRKEYVNSILSTYLSNQKGKYFSMDEFSSLIEEKFEQLSSEDDQILIEAGDYDTIRNSLFHLLDNGQLVQNFNETSNKVELNIKQ